MKKIGFIGLGRMGKAMVEHILEEGVEVVVYNRSREKVDDLLKEYEARSKKHEVGTKDNKKIHNSKFIIHTSSGKLIPSFTISEFVSKLDSPRVIWLMVPHGVPVDEMIDQLLQAGVETDDIVIDGGNSFYKDSIRRYQLLKDKGIHFLDIGTSGGLQGAAHGACLMIGGDKSIYTKVRPLLEIIAKPKGTVTHFGPSGSGHFVKMVHNGVEYGMLQAIGEGFEILSKGMPIPEPFARGPLAKTGRIDLYQVAANWNKGSVVRGWLMELLEEALQQDPHLDSIEGIVGGGETGEWTVATAKELGVKTPVIQSSLDARKESLARPAFSGKVIAALRREFGGHEVRIKKRESGSKNNKNYNS